MSSYRAEALGRTLTENLPAYGLVPTDLQRWSATWNRTLGIVDVLAPLTG